MEKEKCIYKWRCSQKTTKLYQAKSETSLSGDDTNIKYNVPGISYDKNGNILSLIRYGETGEIDNLSYAYENSNYSNRLNAVNDAATADGFSNAGSGINEYTYDLNGNMTNDDNKGLSNIQYNILNLPEYIEKGANTIEYIYDATGQKLVNNLPNGKSYIYLGNFVYNESNALEYILMNEGRVYVNGTSALYEYYLKDHLGNTRVVFDETGATPAQTTHYYPFGMRFNSASTGNPSNKYLYNGKEIQEETDWYDYGWRFYDATLGRFLCADPKAEKYFDTSPYTYCANNPIIFVDPEGDTIALAQDLLDNEVALAAHNKWKATEVGQQFYEIFGEGGEFGNVSVSFGVNTDIVTNNGEIPDASGDAGAFGVDKETGAKTQLNPQTWIDKQASKGHDMSGYRSTLNDGEYLRFEINTTPGKWTKEGSFGFIHVGNGQYIYGYRYGDNVRRLNNSMVSRKSSTINHESKHIRLFMNDFQNYNKMWYNADGHHHFMENPTLYPLDGTFLKK